MKKVFLSLVLLIMTATAYAYEIVPNLSIAIPGTFRSDYEVEVAVNIGAEARFNISDYFMVATGFDWLINRNISVGIKAEREDFGNDLHYNKSKFTMLPVYVGIICFPFGNFGEFKPYLRVDGGYNIYFSISNGENSAPGYYVAGGIGFEFYDTYIAEICMSRYEATDNDDDVSYKNIFFRFGYKFVM